MNIVFLTRRFSPDIGGVEKHVWEITKRLLAKGHKITIITESQEVSQTKLVKGLQIFRIPKTKENKNKKFVIWQWLWKKRAILQNADIVHCHDVFYWYLPFRFLYPQKPVFTTFHGYESYPIKKKAILIRKISEKLSWGNICIGDFIQKWYGTKANYVSYGAVDSSKFEMQSEKLPTRESALFFGRLDEQTGIIQYMRSVEILKKKFPKFKFLIIGDGKYKKLVDKRLKILAFQNEPERYFKDYRFAFVSRYLSILEAFAAKRLVIAVYDNPVKEDYLRMAPYAKFIIIENNAESLAKSIQAIILSPEKEQEMIDQAYEWVKKQSWEKMIQVYEKLWTKAKYDI